MITVSQAKELVLQHTPPPKVESVILERAWGHILAENIKANENSPRFTNSAMDGVAVCIPNQQTGTENIYQRYRIIGESAAGKPYEGTVQDGDAVLISTGAVLPNGANAVIPSEDFEWSDTIGQDGAVSEIFVKKNVQLGQWIRRQASEYKVHDIILQQATVLRPDHIALAAQIGLAQLPIFAPPNVALLATGTEILSVSSEVNVLTSGQIFDSNTPMLQAAIAESGGQCLSPRRIEDSLEATIHALTEVRDHVDIICTTGGVSVGVHDHIKKAAEILGFETIFWRVRQKPGKPLFFAKRNNTLLFGLPGNPVSTLMCFLHYVRPVIASMLGRHHTWRTTKARITKALLSLSGRAEFVRVRLDFASKFSSELSVPAAIPLEKQESFMLTSLTEAEGFVFLDMNENIAEGAMIEVMLF